MRKCHVQISFLFFVAIFFISCLNQNPAGSNLEENKKHDALLKTNTDDNLVSGQELEPQKEQSGRTPTSQPTNAEVWKSGRTSSLTACHPPTPTITTPAHLQHFQSLTAPASIYYSVQVANLYTFSDIYIYIDGIEEDHIEDWNSSNPITGYVEVGFGQHVLKVIAWNNFGINCPGGSYGAVVNHTFYLDPIPPSTAPTINSTWENNHPKIYWNAVTGATGYKIYKSEGSSSNPYSLQATTSSTSYVDGSEISFASCSGSNCNKVLVYYKVKAYNSGGDSPYSNIKQFAVGHVIFDP